jgi:hypothetical protein
MELFPEEKINKTPSWAPADCLAVAQPALICLAHANAVHPRDGNPSVRFCCATASTEHQTASAREQAASLSPFGRSAVKRIEQVQTGLNRGAARMSAERCAIYGPEELSLLGTIFDQAVASLPATMQTPANRMEIAKIVMDRAAAGERELLPLMRFTVAATS